MEKIGADQRTQGARNERDRRCLVGAQQQAERGRNERWNESREEDPEPGHGSGDEIADDDIHDGRGYPRHEKPGPEVGEVETFGFSGSE